MPAVRRFLRHFVSAAVLAAALGVCPARAALVFQFNIGSDLAALQSSNPTLYNNVINGFQDAADLWSGIYTDNITVTLDINYKNLGSGILGQAGSAYVTTSYSNVKTQLTSNATSPDDSTAVTNLPAGSSLTFLINDPSTGTRIVDNDGSTNNTNLGFTKANAKALNFSVSSGSDASITFSSAFPWDFNRANGVTLSQYDFVAVAAHEIGHSLGFVSGVDDVDYYSEPNGPAAPQSLDYPIVSVLDLYRYSVRSVNEGAGGLDMAYGGGGAARPYFSIDGGSTNLGEFSTGAFNGDGNQASHWRDSLSLGIMDPTLGIGELGRIRPRDVRALDVIGYDLAPLNDSVITAASSVALGRMMLGQSGSTAVNLTKTGSVATTYALAPANTGLTVTADGKIDAGNQSESVTVGLTNNSSGSATTGSKTINATLTNLAATRAAAGQGFNDPNNTIQFTATVVDDRTITPSAVSFGSVFAGSSVSGSTTLSTTGGDNIRTRVQVLGTSVAADSNGIGVDAGSTTLFNAGTVTANRMLSGSFLSAGSITGSRNFNVQGEGLVGESVNNVTVNYSATVYDHGTGSFTDESDINDALTSLTLNFGSLTQGASATPLSFDIFNLEDTLSFTAGITFDAPLGSGDTSVLTTSLTAISTTTLAADDSLSFLAYFDTSTPGTFSATYSLSLVDQTGIAGGGELNNLTLILQGNVSSAVPEPGTLLLLSVGLAAACVRRKTSRSRR